MRSYIILYMENVLVQDNPLTSPGNIVFIEFYNKKHFPPGIWMSEPDFCLWESYGLLCLAIRDMSLGMWRGFVQLTEGHLVYGKDFKYLLDEDLITHIDVHGGLSTIGKLPNKYKEYNQDSWWIGFECTQGEDYLPLITYDETHNEQTYKTLHFVRRETNYLAKELSKIKLNE